MSGASDRDDASAPVPPPLVELETSELSQDELRQALGRFVTGVTIVTCRDAEGNAVGLTANSFNALSLDPPLVLWSLRQSSSKIAAFSAASHFVINVLADDQVDLSRRFARSAPATFDADAWSDGHGGAPVLAGCVAVFECRRHSHQQAGDHVLFIGEVRRIAGSAATPLVYHAGHYRTLQAAE